MTHVSVSQYVGLQTDLQNVSIAVAFFAVGMFYWRSCFDQGQDLSEGTNAPLHGRGAPDFPLLFALKGGLNPPRNRRFGEIEKCNTIAISHCLGCRCVQLLLR